MKRQICVFCEAWASGGIESFFANILTKMERADLTIDLVASELRESVFREDLERCGVRFHELSGSRWRIGENRKLLKKLLSERSYDVFHANLYEGVAFTYLDAARRAGVPTRVAHSHNTRLRANPLWPVKMAGHEAGKLLLSGTATDYWACSRDAARFLFSDQKDFHFIPNGIDTNRFRFSAEVRGRVRTELNLGEALVVGNVGRLCSQKNQAFLLDAFASLVRQRPDSILLLLGGGADLPLLQKRAENLGIYDRVRFLGTTDRVEDYLCAMDVFAFPSRFEGLGIVAIEAQASGLPVLCSERVPEEAKALPLARSLPLSAGAERWAEELLHLAAKREDRTACADAVRDKGYDSGAVARRIETFYLTGRLDNE